MDPEAGALTLRADDGRSSSSRADYLEHAHYGYALTGHVSQGATVERTYLLASPERGGAEWAYVAASRHRIDLRVYLSADEPERAAEALAERWERRQAKHLATERLEAAGRAAAEHGPAPAREPEAPVPAAERAPAGGAEDPLAALRAERAALLAELRAGGPPDPSEALRRLGAERGLVGAELERVREERARAEAERAGIGRLRLLGRAGQAEAARLEEHRPGRRGARAGAGAGAAATIARERAGAEAQAAARAAFAAGLPALCRRLEALEAALAGAERPVGEDGAGPPAPDRARPRRSPPSARSWPSTWSAAARPTRARSFGRLGQELAQGRAGPGRHRCPGAAPGRVGSRPSAPCACCAATAGPRCDASRPSFSAREERAEDAPRAPGRAPGPTGRAPRPERAAREAWERDEAPVLGRRVAALDAGARPPGRRERAQSAERERPAYLEHALGPRPEHERPLERWRQAVRELEGYRARHGITDPERALGPEPSRARPRPRAPPGRRRPGERPLGDQAGRPRVPLALQPPGPPRPGGAERALDASAAPGPAPRAAPGPEPRPGDVSGQRSGGARGAPAAPRRAPTGARASPGLVAEMGSARSGSCWPWRSRASPAPRRTGTSCWISACSPPP